MDLFSKGRIIAAVRNRREFDQAVSGKAENIFILAGNILEIPYYTDTAAKNGKRIFLHMDMFEGLGRDAAAVEFVSKFSPYGIISTRGNIIKHAKTLGLCTVQRFFIVDGQSVKTALETVHQTKPSYAELMPGLVYKAIQAFAQEKTPIIAGGLVSTEEEVNKVLQAGAVAVSTSVKELYN